MKSLFLSIGLAMLLTAPLPAARGKITDDDRGWWAFQPVTERPVPVQPESRSVFTVAAGDQWATENAIDAFVGAKLLENGLDFAPEASREVLVRRLYFDVWGLPPPAGEAEALMNDPAPDAYERLVDRLLANSHYGERWARHWLDLVRYADSDGYKADDYRPEAWRYRDWVISALNSDMGYDRFVTLQLAGDELFPDDPEALIATGYLRCGIYEYNNRDAAGQWTAILNDITDTTSDVFLGLGLQCARCHDHKFDPLLQRDYYRLQAFFAPLQWPEHATVGTAEQRKAWQEKQTAWETATADVRRQIAEIEERYRLKAREDATSKFPPETQAIMNKSADQRTAAERPVFDLAWRQVTYEWDRIDNRIKGADKEKIVQLRKQLSEYDTAKPDPLPQAMVAHDAGPVAPPVTIPPSGGSSPAIEPGFPFILDPDPAVVVPGAATTGRRSALARWITRPGHPLTARVIVNRVWQQHFGRGLSSTASDFGRLGERPSHPELLDWLAQRFVQDGWSLKRLHRLILTSRAWRQGASSAHGARARMIDPENRWLWRWSTRRLDSEQIRDAIFAATGELDLTAGGPGADHTKPRRAIYVKVLRNVRDPLTDVFDAPQQFNSAPARDTTTTATQSLLLANSRLLLDRADTMGRMLIARHRDNDEALIEDAWRRTAGRRPTTDEREEAQAFLREQADGVAGTAAAETEASGEFIDEAMPQRAGRAAVLAPGSVQERLVAEGISVPTGDFTLECVVLLHSVFDDGRVRTIASQWNGDKSQPGWSLGVTGKKSRRKPQTPVLQLTGNAADGAVVDEPVFSDIPLQLDRSYYIAAAVHCAPDGKGTVNFFVKDLANDDEPLQTAAVPHPVAVLPPPAFPLVIGDCEGPRRLAWDGLIDEVRLRRGCVGESALCLTNPAMTPDTAACWQFEPAPGPRCDTVTGMPSIRAAGSLQSTARAMAVEDMCHSLLSSSALLYLE